MYAARLRPCHCRCQKPRRWSQTSSSHQYGKSQILSDIPDGSCLHAQKFHCLDCQNLPTVWRSIGSYLAKFKRLSVLERAPLMGCAMARSNRITFFLPPSLGDPPIADSKPYGFKGDALCHSVACSGLKQSWVRRTSATIRKKPPKQASQSWISAHR